MLQQPSLLSLDGVGYMNQTIHTEILLVAELLNEQQSCEDKILDHGKITTAREVQQLPIFVQHVINL